MHVCGWGRRWLFGQVVLGFCSGRLVVVWFGLFDVGVLMLRGRFSDC